MRASDDKKQTDVLKNDADIKTQKHDEIVVWLYEKLKDQSFLKQLLKNDEREIKDTKIVLEHPVLDSNYKNKVVGVIDLVLGCKIISSEESHPNYVRLNFEIKSKFNLGETVRQIKYYKQFLYGEEGEFWIVCCPPHPHMKILEEQGIKYIEYPN